MTAAQAWRHEFKSQHPHERAALGVREPGTPASLWEWRQEHGWVCWSPVSGSGESAIPRIKVEMDVSSGFHTLQTCTDTACSAHAHAHAHTDRHAHYAHINRKTKN